MIKKLLLMICFLSLTLSLKVNLNQYFANKQQTDIGVNKCRFARAYTQNDFDNPNKVQQFLKEYIQWETQFIKKVGVHQKTGLTYDGYRIDVKTGQLLSGGLHYWTASSKQSIHIGLLAKVLENNSFAKMIYNVQQVFLLIEKKVITFQAFNKKYPGFGGYMPWVFIRQLNTTIPEPTQDFQNQTPALDNGQMFWAALSLSQIWKENYPQKQPQLRQRWDKITWKIMIQNSRKIFYNETTGKIRAVAKMQDSSKPPSQNTYSNDINYYLDDPYEGQLFCWIITLFGEEYGLFTKDQIDFLWVDKRSKLKSINYQVHSYRQNNNDIKQITVQKGFWFSAHQQWKNLFMPYYLSKTYKIIQQNNEKARTWHSIDKLIPGMYASVTGPADTNQANMDYYSDCGIQQISVNKVYHTLMVTPYSSYPLFLVNKTVAVKWLHNMVYSPAGQTIYGSTEATSIDGMHISPVLTWDSKITTVLALMEGTTSIIQRYLKQNSYLDKFVQRLQSQYQRQFKDIKGSQLRYANPITIISRGRSDFTSCQ